MLKKNIVLQYHYIPIYKFKIFNSKQTLENSELYYKSAVSLPIYFKLKNSEINYIVRNLHNFLRFYSRN